MTHTMTAERLRAGTAFPSTPLEDQLRPHIWRRKQLAAVTFGIEIRGVSIMLESDWDRSAAAVRSRVGTGDPLLDEFWAAHFSPMTTKWIWQHPLLDDVAQTFDRYRTIMGTHFDFTCKAHADFVKRPC